MQGVPFRAVAQFCELPSSLPINCNCWEGDQNPDYEGITHEGHKTDQNLARQAKLQICCKKMSRGSWRWINVGSHGIKRKQIFIFKNNNLLPITVKLRTILLCSFFKQEWDGNSFSGMYAMCHSKQNFCISRSIFDIKMSFMSVLAFEFHRTLHAAFGQSSARHFTASANIPLKTVCFDPEAYWILT